MVAELIAMAAGAVGSSYLTRYLVRQEITTKLDGLANNVEASVKKYATALDVQAKARFDDLKKTHVEAIAKQVELEVKNTAASAVAKVCSFCGKQVAAFEKIEDKIKCVNCKKAGK